MIKYKYSFIALVLFGLIGFTMCCNLAIAPPAAAQITPTPPPEPTPFPEPTPTPAPESTTTTSELPATTTSVDASTTSAFPEPTPFPTTSTIDDTCTFVLDATTLTFPYTTGAGRIQVTASRPLCIWSSSTAAAWITITAGLSNNSGDGAVEFTVAENTLPSERSATLYVAGQEVKVTQKASPAPGSTTTTTVSVSTSSIKPTTSISASTTTTAPFCPIRNILGEQPENILLLTEFRNKVLLNSSVGKHYVLRYYQHALELRQIIQQNPSIRDRAAAFIQSITPDISLMLQQKKPEISPDVINEGIKLCDLVSAEASPGLQEVLKNLKHDITGGAFLSQLGIHVRKIKGASE